MPQQPQIPLGALHRVQLDPKKNGKSSSLSDDYQLKLLKTCLDCPWVKILGGEEASSHKWRWRSLFVKQSKETEQSLCGLECTIKGKAAILTGGAKLPGCFYFLRVCVEQGFSAI